MVSKSIVHILFCLCRKTLASVQSKLSADAAVFEPKQQSESQSEVYAIARICYRPSVCPSVCLSVTLVDQSKTVEVRIMQLSPPGSPMTLVSSRLTSPRNSKGKLGSEGAK